MNGLTMRVQMQEGPSPQAHALQHPLAADQGCALLHVHMDTRKVAMDAQHAAAGRHHDIQHLNQLTKPASSLLVS